jgi:hypothetical protein
MLKMHSLNRASLKSLAQLTALENLDVSSNDKIDDAGWAGLAALGQLRRLVMIGNKFGAKAAKALSAAVGAARRVEDQAARQRVQVARCHQHAARAAHGIQRGERDRIRPPGGAAVLATNRGGGRQGFGRARRAGAAPRAALAVACRLRAEARRRRRVGEARGLSILDLNGNKALGQSACAALGSLSLRGLDASECGVGSKGLAALSQIADLEWLAVKQNGIDDLLSPRW